MSARSVSGREELTEALREAIAVDDGPRLVQVPVATGHVVRVSAVAAPDRAPDWVAAGRPSRCARGSWRRSAPIGSWSRATDLIAYASDASPYRMIPQAVVMPRDVEDVVRLLAFARANAGRRSCSGPAGRP